MTYQFFTHARAKERAQETTTLKDRVAHLLSGFGATRLHDTILCHAYHLLFDGWDYIDQGPNHWIIAIPEPEQRARDGEASDSSLSRLRREVARDTEIPTPSLSLESFLSPAWNQEEWERYRAERTNAALAPSGQDEDLELELEPPLQEPCTLVDQVGWLLANHPETRESDRELTQRWMLTWGGWREGSLQPDGKRTYAIPKAHHWQATTPESITRSRRKWHRKGLFLPSSSTQHTRATQAQEIAAAYREGSTPAGWIESEIESESESEREAQAQAQAQEATVELP